MRIEPVRGAESRLPVPPQIALRVAALGVIALVMFGIIFFRLWYLQILTGNRYVHLVSEQQSRMVPVPAPRGEILARNGEVLVASRTSSAVQVVPSQLPPGIEGQVRAYEAARRAAGERLAAARARLKRYETRYANVKHPRRVVEAEMAKLRRAAEEEPQIPIAALPSSASRLSSLFRRLGRVLHMPARRIDELVVQGVSTTAYAPVTVDASASAAATITLAERKREFPGVEQRPVAVPYYPYGEMAAQVFGHVGPVSQEELEKGPYKGTEPGTIVGQDGLEYYYDKYLQGTPGKEKILVNSLNEPISEPIPVTQPQAGYSLKTTLDLPLQQAGEQALRGEIKIANEAGRPADAGAFVAMNPINGEIYAMGSYPSYDPEVFTRPISTAEYNRLVPPGPPPATGGEPLINRAVESGYPVGSTFKPIMAIGALEEGFLNTTEEFGAGKCIVENGEEFCNAESGFLPNVDLVHALEVSSDIYFYTVGKRGFSHPNALQRWAKRLGIGRRTGIDLPSELTGVVPNEEWVKKLDAAEERCTREDHGTPCHIVYEPHELWTVGQSMQLATGQGGLATSPLQMSVAYAALIDAYRNGGEATVVTPHLGMQIDESNGGLVQSLTSEFKIRRRFHLNPEYLHAIFEGIHDAATGPGGTSTNVWVGWNQSAFPVYAKTGTAERFGQETQAWYMCYIGTEKNPLLLAVTVEQGGYGDQAAAPVARAMAEQFYHQPKARLVAGLPIP